MTKRPKILVLNQYYWPGVEATGVLLAQLCEGLARDFEVTVVTGCLGSSSRPERVVRNGVEIVRVPSTAFDRTRIGPRAVNYLTFLVSSAWEALRAPRPDIVLCMTDPPILGNVALPVARRFGVPLVVVTQDVFPEIAVQLGRLENPIVVELLRWMIGLYVRHAEAVVAIGETMRRRLEEKGASPSRIAVISNWANTDIVQPMPRQNGWATEHGFAGRFVVMHSGNVGHAQDLDILVRSATFLRDLDDLSVVVIGAGARRDEIDALAGRLEAPVTFLPYQPVEIVASSLSSADVHFVGLAPGLAGYVVPSRVYGIMAAARPMIVSADAESETARLVQEIGCGIVVEPGRPDLVAGAIREARERRDDLEVMGRRGYEYVQREATRDVAVGRYRSLLAGLTGHK